MKAKGYLERMCRGRRSGTPRLFVIAVLLAGLTLGLTPARPARAAPAAFTVNVKDSTISNAGTLLPDPHLA